MNFNSGSLVKVLYYFNWMIDSVDLVRNVRCSFPLKISLLTFKVSNKLQYKWNEINIHKNVDQQFDVHFFFFLIDGMDTVTTSTLCLNTTQGGQSQRDNYMYLKQWYLYIIGWSPITQRDSRREMLSRPYRWQGGPIQLIAVLRKMTPSFVTL